MGSDADDVRARVDDFLASAPDPAADGGIPFRRAQFDAGLAWVHHPEGRGGLGLPANLQHVVDDALDRAGVVDLRPFNPIGHGNAVPVLLAHGTTEQQDRFLRGAFTSEHIWCQLMSEPTAGSDVAGLSTRAVRDGDGWIVNGQKVWTGFAHVARYGMLVARTDPDVVKHAGITCFIVDMEAPGVDVRPLRQMTGRAEFNEVFLTDVHLGDDLRVGEVNAGWRVVHANLEGERLAFTGGRAGARPVAPAILERLRAAWITDPCTRDRAVRTWMDMWLLDHTIARAAELRGAGRDALHACGLKVLRSESSQALAELELDLMGADALLYPQGYGDGEQEEEFSTGRDINERFLRTRAGTIEGGTSEVNRNVLAEQALGLPRDVRPDIGVPWRAIPR